MGEEDKSPRDVPKQLCWKRCHGLSSISWSQGTFPAKGATRRRLVHTYLLYPLHQWRTHSNLVTNYIVSFRGFLQFPPRKKNITFKEVCSFIIPAHCIRFNNTWSNYELTSSADNTSINSLKTNVYHERRSTKPTLLQHWAGKTFLNWSQRETLVIE